MKKVSKSNPLKTFNDNKAMAHKKAGGAMSEYKKYLKKAQDGMSFNNTYQGPLTESDSKRLDKEFPSTATQIPYAPSKPNMGYGTEDMYRQKEANDRSAYTNYLKSPAVNLNNKLFKTGLQPNQSIQNQEGNAEATKNVVNKMNNIDWNSEEGKRYKNGNSNRYPTKQLGRPKKFSVDYGKQKLGGSTKKALGGVANDPTKKEVRKEMRAVNKMDRQDKRWNRKEDRIQAREERKTNKENAKILMASKRF
jgi:hypothetical protein